MMRRMQTPATRTPRPVATSLDELLAGAAERAPLAHGDGKSGSPLERLVIDGEPYVLKTVHIDADWTMRAFRLPCCIPLEVWRSGLMDTLPERIDHAVVAAAGGLGRDGLGGALLMRDVGAELVPEGAAPLTMDQHVQLLGDLAALAARTWGWTDDVGLLPYGNRWVFASDDLVEAERRRGFADVVPRLMAEGWERFAERAAPGVRDLVLDLRRQPQPLVDSLAVTPQCFLHGDWKLGNTGLARDGRTILLDWTYCGPGPVAHELGWYLALNRARLPETKEATIETFRRALQEHGVATDPWWERQVGLCLLGTVVQFGWEKALGGDDELAWWCDRAREGASHL